MHWPEYNSRTPRTDLRSCKRLLQSGSRSFFAASLLLPQPARNAAVSLYAFCRLADDAIDDSDNPTQALLHLRARVDGVYSGNPENCAADRSLAVVVKAYGIPRELIDALLEGFAWDCSGRTYHDLGALREYAARVAGAVGVMMALLMGRRESAVLARAADLGVAMQLTNIARDVGEDAQNGRLYLPLSWFAERGVEPEDFLAAPAPTDWLSDILQTLLLEADRLYLQSESGIANLPAGCRPCVMTARLLYAEIGEEVRRNRFDSVTRRAVVSPGRKCLTVAQLARLRAIDNSTLGLPPLPETAFLVEAVARAPAPEPLGSRQPGRLEWTLDLFAELDQRQRARRQRPDAPLLSEPAGGESAAF
jgi:phytoene synthase